jgi:hypothetical protein
MEPQVNWSQVEKYPFDLAFYSLYTNLLSNRLIASLGFLLKLSLRVTTGLEKANFTNSLSHSDSGHGERSARKSNPWGVLLDTMYN